MRYFIEDGKFSWYYFNHTIIRALNFFAYFWCIMTSIKYATLAGLNFGIIASCSYTSIIINIAVGYYSFKETISLKKAFGILVTISGIVWISLSKSASKEDNQS